MWLVQITYNRYYSLDKFPTKNISQYMINISVTRQVEHSLGVKC